MPALPKILFALTFLACLSSAMFDNFITLNCAFSTNSQSVSADATYYYGNAPSCVPMNLLATVPNGTVMSYGASSCSLGVHHFTFAAPQNGLYALNATYLNISSTCGVAVLLRQQHQPVPDLPPALALAAGGLALFASRRKRF